MKLTSTRAFLTFCLIVSWLPAGAQTTPTQSQTSPAKQVGRTNADSSKLSTPGSPRKYFLPGDTLEGEELLQMEKERRKRRQDLLDQLENLNSLNEDEGLEKSKILEALEALEALDEPSAEARKAIEDARRRLHGLVVLPPGVPGGTSPDFEVILPDTIYTTQITIGPEGIEYYDTSGTPVAIRGEPAGLDEAFVLSDDGDLITITDKQMADIVEIGTDVTIEKGERVEGNVITFGGCIHVEGEIKGDAVAILGDVYVNGYVHGSAVSPTGTVQVGPSGRVRRDVVGGAIILQPGALVGGKKEYTSIRMPARPELFQGIYLAIFFISLGVAVFVIFLTLLAHAFAAKNIKTVSIRISESGAKSFFVGLVSILLGVPLAFVLLIITIIGIPVALLVLPLAVVLAQVIGYAAVGLRFGEKLSENRIVKTKSQLVLTLLGTTALLTITLIGCTLFIIPVTPLNIVGWVFFGIGNAISFIATMTGIGAVVLTRFGTRLYKSKTVQPTPSTIPPPPPPGSIRPGPSVA